MDLIAQLQIIQNKTKKLKGEIDKFSNTVGDYLFSW